jgi:hypothetical protein
MASPMSAPVNRRESVRRTGLIFVTRLDRRKPSRIIARLPNMQKAAMGATWYTVMRFASFCTFRRCLTVVRSDTAVEVGGEGSTR